MHKNFGISALRGILKSWSLTIHLIQIPTRPTFPTIKGRARSAPPLPRSGASHLLLPLLAEPLQGASCRTRGPMPLGDASVGTEGRRRSDKDREIPGPSEMRPAAESERDTACPITRGEAGPSPPPPTPEHTYARGLGSHPGEQCFAIRERDIGPRPLCKGAMV